MVQLRHYSASIQGQLISSNMPAPFCGKVDNTKINLLEKFLLTVSGADTTGGNVEHYFAEGLYARKLSLPAGSAIVGKIHLKGQLNFLMKGTIRVTVGNEVKELSAPCIIPSLPGVKRAGFALTNVEWVTVSATTNTDLADIEKELIAKDFNDPRLVTKLEAICLGEL